MTEGRIDLDSAHVAPITPDGGPTRDLCAATEVLARERAPGVCAGRVARIRDTAESLTRRRRSRTGTRANTLAPVTCKRTTRLPIRDL